MSFAPSKGKKPRARPDNTRANAAPVVASKEPNPELGQLQDTGSKASQSIRSRTDEDYPDRFTQLSHDVSRLQQQQDTYAQLLALSDTVAQLQKDHKAMSGLARKVANIEDRLDEFHQRFDEHQHRVDERLNALAQDISRGAQDTADTAQVTKKACAELDRRQKDMDYQIKMDIRDTQIKAKEDMVAVTSDIDRKVDAHKEYFETNLNDVHRKLKSDIIDHSDKLDELDQRLSTSNQEFERKLGLLESVLPSLDSTSKRRKIDYEDLKAWLLGSIDQRMAQNEKKLHKTIKTYTSSVNKQKAELSEFKKELTAMPHMGPTREAQVDDAAKEQPADLEAEEGKSEVVVSANRYTGKCQSSELEYFQNSVSKSEGLKQKREEMDSIEKYIHTSSDEIGKILDQQKISIYDWNDKIVSAVKANYKLTKSKKKADKEKLKG